MDTRVLVEIGGVDKYVAKLEKAKRGFDELEVPLKKAGEMALAAVKSYPEYGNWYSGNISSSPFRPGSNYRRTFNLQNAWQGRSSRGGPNTLRYSITLRAGSPARKYAPYVVGQGQAAVHTFWWMRLVDWPPILEPYIVSIFNKWSKKFR